LPELVMAIAELEPGIRRLVRLREAVDHDAELFNRRLEGLVDVVDLAQPVPGVRQQAALRMLLDEGLEGAAGLVVARFPKQPEGGLVIVTIAAAGRGRPAAPRRATVLQRLQTLVEIEVDVALPLADAVHVVTQRLGLAAQQANLVLQ